MTSIIRPAQRPDMEVNRLTLTIKGAYPGTKDCPSKSIQSDDFCLRRCKIATEDAPAGFRGKMADCCVNRTTRADKPNLRVSTAAASRYPESMTLIADRRTFRCYDRGSGDVCREITSFSGLPPILLQRLPEQKNLPNAQASTRREFGPFMAIVA